MSSPFFILFQKDEKEVFVTSEKRTIPFLIDIV